MKLEAPILNVSETASKKLIDKTISGLEPEPDHFSILSKDEMSYIQCLRTEHGFIVQFQLGSLNEHYEFETYLSRPQSIKLFCGFLNQTDNWQGDLKYNKVNLHSIWHRMGYAIGSFIGNFIRGFREEKAKRRNK